MNPIVIINPEHPGQYYALFYTLAFLVGFILLLVEGRKRKFPTMLWMLVISSAFLFFMIGCQLITFSATEWASLLHFEAIPYSTGRSVLGGILLGVPGILIARKYLRFENDMVDSFALVLPIGLMIERFGCLLSGCCYGTPTSLPWAVAYGQNSEAFSRHVQNGIISLQATQSHGVHPVQLYEVLCCIGILVVLIRKRNNFRVPGNYLLVSVGLYAATRFFLEFIRAHDSESTLTFLQWSILMILPFLVYHIFQSERSMSGTNTKMATNQKVNMIRPVAYFLFISILLLIVSRWLRPLEIISFQIVMIPVVVTLCICVFRSITIPGFRIATLLLPGLSLLLMNQTLPERYDSTRQSFTSLNFGALGGKADLIYGDDHPDNCNAVRTAYTSNFSAKYLGISRTIQTGNSKSTTFGLNWATGHHTEVVNGQNVTPAENKFSTMIFSPYVQVDRPEIGVGFGLHVGDFTRIVPTDNGDASSVRRMNLFPSASFRVGNLSRVFFEYKLANQTPLALPTAVHQFDLGFGFGNHNGGALRVGTATNTAVFISTSIPFQNRLLMNFMIGSGGGLLNPYDHTHTTIGSLSFQYNFRKK